MTRTDNMPGGSTWRKEPTTGSRKDSGSSRKDNRSSRKDGYAGSGSGAWRKRSPPSPSSSQEDTEEGGRSYRSAFETNPENRRAYSPVAETLFRKDLISAMKLPDNEPLGAEDFWTVQDTWKQEWEKGVQVPVKPDGLPEPQVSLVPLSTKRERFGLPRKLICMNASGSYTAETHQVTPMVLRAEQVCGYDLDDVDQRWLSNLNGERGLMGQSLLTENEMERTIEELERQCRDKINSSLRSSEDTQIQQDDSIICDVCRSPDSEETNEMVFCDQCNICVHQACYGIMSIPDGPWLCRTCSLGIKPPCQLCPNKGGAMKSTRSGQKWAHVSCALWIPEVSIGCVEKMEPITKISSIPQSRWSLVCVLCKEKTGSCIQCSVKTCKTAYHVTCAFRHNLEMRAIIDDENSEDGVKLRSYCQKHSLNSKKTDDSDSESGSRKQNLSPEDRRKKIARFEREFFKLVDTSTAASKVELSLELVDFIYRYWILKRRAGGNKALLVPRGEEESLSSVKGEDTERDKMKMLVGIRQDLERVRNLAYMVSRREKLSRGYVKLKEQILERQLALISDEDPANQMTLMEMSAVLEANHGPTIYDKTYSHEDSEQHSYEDFEAIISRISGEINEGSAQIRRDNPVRKRSTESTASIKPELRYERIFSDTSQSESDDSFIQNVKPLNSRRSNLSKKSHKDIKKKPIGKKSSKSSKLLNHTDSSISSSEEEAELKKLSPRKELNKSASKTKTIYSESESDHDLQPKGRGRGTKSKKSAKDSLRLNNESLGEWRDSEDTQNSMDRPRSPVFRTKAAMKEFSLPELSRAKESSRTGSKSSDDVLKKSSKLKLARDSSHSETEPMDVDDKPPIMLVPQRSAARKASQKLNKKETEDLKKGGRGVKTSELFGDSESDVEILKSGSPLKPRDVRKSPRVKHGANTSYNSDLSEDESSKPVYSKKDEELKSKQNQKSKFSKASLSSSIHALSESDEDVFAFPKDKDVRPSKKSKKKKIASSAGESEFDSLFDTDIRPPSGPDSESDKEFLNKKREFDDFENPEMFSFVPQRKAAKKASAQLREQDMWKKSQQEALLASALQAKMDKADPTRKLGKVSKKSKKSQSDSESELFKRRTRSSDSSVSSGSESDSDAGKSHKGRGKSPKGKKPGKTQSPRPNKPIVKRQKSKKSPRAAPDGAITSSKALEYLSQRESQISNILGSLTKEDKEEIDKAGKDPPDKKLKTSEGRPEGVQSPPSSSKTSSDSESDTDTDDSVIQRLKSDKTSDKQLEPLARLPSDTLRPIESGVESKEAKDTPSRGGRGDISDSSVDRQKGRSRGFGEENFTGDHSIFDPSSRASPSQNVQLQQPGSREDTPKKSIFSPDRSPPRDEISERLSPAAFGPGEHESTSQKENESPSQWGSPRGRKQPGTRSPRISSSSREKVRDILTQTKSPTKSPALNRSLDSSLNRSIESTHNNSPLPNLLKSPIGMSPSLATKDIHNKSHEDKTAVDIFKPALNKSDNEPEEEIGTGRKFSVESKDSDADSAKSSLTDGNGLLQDISKEDSTDTLEFTDKLSDTSLKIGTQKGVHQTKTDEGYVSAEKPVAVQPSPVFENNIHDSVRRKDIHPSLDNIVSSLEKSSAMAQKESFDFGLKHQNPVPDHSKAFQPSALQQLTQEQQMQFIAADKPKDDLSTFYNQTSSTGHKTNNSMSSSDLQQYFQQQQLQQQMLQDPRSWPQYNQEQQKQKQDLDTFGKPDKKNTDALVNHQQQLYNEALLNQMFTMQSKSQQVAYAQQYVKELAGFGLNQNLDLYTQAQAHQLHYQTYLQAAYGKKMQNDILNAAWQEQMAGWSPYTQGVNKISELEKMSRNSLSDLEKITREQNKEKMKQPSLSLVQQKMQESRRDQPSYMDQLRPHQDQRSFQEQMRTQEKRAQSESVRQDDSSKYSHPGSQVSFLNDPKSRIDPTRSHLDALAQFGMIKTDKSPDKSKAGRSSQDHLPPDMRQRSHQDQKHQQELKKHSDPFRNQFNIGSYMDSTNQDQQMQYTSAQKSRPVSPRHEKQNLSSCRMEPQKVAEPVYGIPSATPADKLPGFVHSVAHSRDQKRHSQEGANEYVEPVKEQKKGRDTPASVAGSDASLNSAPSGIPNELLDSVLETAKLPVWKPPDKSDVKISSPAKPPQASPPKPPPVISERDTISLEELVKHIDASPSPRDNRIEKLSSIPPYLTSPLSVKSSTHEKTESGSTPAQLLYSNIPGFMGANIAQSDKEMSEAERSDYDNDQHDKGGVDYDDDEDEDDLPLGNRRKGLDASSQKVSNEMDISSWKSDATDSKPVKAKPEATEETKPKQAVTKRGTKVPCYKEEPELPVVEKASEVLTKRGTKVPCYKEKEVEESSPARIPLVKKVLTPIAKGKAKGRGGARMFSRNKGPKYDQKAFEKVHKNLVGTDFDFEDEFDDDSGFTPKEDVPGSLRDFREQTKSKKSNDSFDFDDLDNSGLTQMPPVQLEPEEEDLKLSLRTKIGVKGKSRAKSNKNLVEKEPEVKLKIIPLKIKKIAERKEEKPKIPKLKIKFGARTESPLEAEDGVKNKKAPEASEESSVPPIKLKIPTLKIKLPPKPEDLAKVAEEEPEKRELPQDLEMEPPVLIIRSTPKSPRSPAKSKSTPVHHPTSYPGDDLDDVEPPKQDFSLESLKSDFVKSSPKLNLTKSPAATPPTAVGNLDPCSANVTSEISPRKAKGSIDLLASNLMAKKQSNTLPKPSECPMDKANELAAIFGPEEPLPVNMGAESEIIAAVADRTEDGPSELDLLTLELKKLEKEKLPKEDEEKKDERRSTVEELPRPEYIPERYEEENHHHHHLKYKFKPSATDFSRNTTSPGPNTPVKISIVPPNSDVGQRRMRKKELLNSYFGIETPSQPAPPTHPVANGPVYHADTPKEPFKMNIIKIPKAVASVTSVPTRADYQSQMEANMERKRKREGKEEPKVKGQKKGKGKQNKNEEDVYKPKLKKSQEIVLEPSNEKGEVRRTRGMPPKKCLLEDSPEREEPLDSFKKSNMRFAEEMLKNFDSKPADKERRKKDKKRRREEEDKEQPNTKTPRIVIKFSKTKDQQPKPPGPDNNGLAKSDSALEGGGHSFTKLKIKSPVK